MQTDINNSSDVEARLWKELKAGHLGMLGLTGVTPAQHFQPMTPMCEPETGEIWFFTRTDTDLARAVATGADAMFVFQSKDMDVQACIAGRLEPRNDRARIDKFWNPVVAAWYPEGKDDPRLILLAMAARDAEVWISQGGPIHFAWEIAKANLTHETPDLGGQASIKLGASAR